MKQLIGKNGTVLVENVPAPGCSAGNLLIQVRYSCVSPGTEKASLGNSAMPLYRRALKQPEHVKRVLDMAREQGLSYALERLKGKLQAGSAIGYSAAGEVVETGPGLGFRAGDRVACAGAGIANHAEFAAVPVNLAVSIPDGVTYEEACTVALGSIALQGVRRAQLTLGERVLVIGMGFLGQLTAQMVRANGCACLGVDLDRRRMETALAKGLHRAVHAESQDVIDEALRFSDGVGVDAAIITAASQNSAIVRQAMQACRKKGRVVLVGDVGLDLQRSDFYAKELDFLISCSYGPGRYDPAYEDRGQDYPLPWVRWTENRNMQEYLRLLASGQVSLSGLYPEAYDVDCAEQAYQRLSETDRPCSVILRYPEREGAAARTVRLPGPRKPVGSAIRVAVVGAGSFAQGVHLPNMSRLHSDCAVHCVMSRTGANAKAIAQQYKAQYATTAYSQVLLDPDVDLVILSTRHNLHGSMTLEALEAGKHVFVEKPLALTTGELDAIEAFYRSGGSAKPVLMTGFNRRFSPAISWIREAIANRTAPLMVNYRMNAGYLPQDHWVHGEEGGGRNIGEACHIYDLFGCLTGARAIGVHAAAIAGRSGMWQRNDNFAATISFDDGSVCSLIYTALGHKSHPKEQAEIFVDGNVIQMSEYKTVSLAGAKSRTWSNRTVDKGHVEELRQLLRCLREGGSWPVSLEDQLQATRISFEVEQQVSA